MTANARARNTLTSTVLSAMTLLSFAACTSIRLTPDLDRTLSENGKRLAAKTQIMMPPGSRYIDVSEKFRSQFAAEGLYKISVLPQKKHFDRNEGFQCFEPYLLVLSIGLIPAICEHEITTEFEWQNGNSPPEKKTVSFKYERVDGWVSFIYSLFPGWRQGLATSTEAVIANEINAKASTAAGAQ